MKNIFYYIIILFFLFSCDIKEKGIEAQEKIKIENKFGNQVITHYDIPLKATDIAGNDITSQTEFFVDGNAINGNILNFPSPGTHIITAQINIDGETKASDPINLNVIDPQSSTKILVEDFTGTWCVNCPRVTYKLEQAVSQSDHIVPTAIHFGPNLDPYSYAGFNYFQNNYQISAFPTALVNRNLVWDEDYASLQTQLDRNQPIGLAIQSSINGTALNVEVKVRFDMDFSSEDLRLVIYLNENGLIYDQDNGTNYYGGQNPIPDFEHNHTLRAALVGENGITIDQNKGTNQIFTYSFNGNIPSNIENINNCEIVAFVTDNGNPIKVINVQKAAINTQQDFD